MSTYAMNIKSIQKIILFVVGASLLNIISIIGNSAFAVLVGGIIALVSFRKIFNQLEVNICKNTLLLIFSQLAISCFSTLGLEIYCKFWNYQEWCNRNLFILSSFPLYVSIAIWLIIPISQICRRADRNK